MASPLSLRRDLSGFGITRSLFLTRSAPMAFLARGRRRRRTRATDNIADQVIQFPETELTPVVRGHQRARVADQLADLGFHEQMKYAVYTQELQGKVVFVANQPGQMLALLGFHTHHLLT